MKWGHAYEVEGSERLLYQVISWIIAQSSPVDNWLDKILMQTGSFGGDPGWEIEHIHAENISDSFRIWADPEISGIEANENIFSAADVHRAMKETLIAFAKAYPERSQEVDQTLKHYHL